MFRFQQEFENAPLIEKEADEEEFNDTQIYANLPCPTSKENKATGFSKMFKGLFKQPSKLKDEVSPPISVEPHDREKCPETLISKQSSDYSTYKQRPLPKVPSPALRSSVLNTSELPRPPVTMDLPSNAKDVYDRPKESTKFSGGILLNFFYHFL